eukprot:3689999-Rhodomonas_salina.5
MSSLLVFGKSQILWTAKTPVWQGHRQWAKQPGYVQAGGTGAQVYTTGSRDLECINNLLSAASSFTQDGTEEEWVDCGPILSSGRDVFLSRVEAHQYDNGTHMLASTDGSLPQLDGRVGAG